MVNCRNSLRQRFVQLSNKCKINLIPLLLQSHTQITFRMRQGVVCSYLTFKMVPESLYDDNVWAIWWPWQQINMVLVEPELTQLSPTLTFPKRDESTCKAQGTFLCSIQNHIPLHSTLVNTYGRH